MTTIRTHNRRRRAAERRAAKPPVFYYGFIRSWQIETDPLLSIIIDVPED